MKFSIVPAYIAVVFAFCFLITVPGTFLEPLAVYFHGCGKKKRNAKKVVNRSSKSPKRRVLTISRASSMGWTDQLMRAMSF